jgi:hypothetical protein
LRLVCAKPETTRRHRSDIDAPLVTTEAVDFRGIGDILLPYYLLESLDIDWSIIKKKDPRIKAMEDCANAKPVIRTDFRFSRPCMLSTVVNLHINLGTTPHLAKQPQRDRAAQQLDLILQQFDLPALRNFHLSYEADVAVEVLEDLWSRVVSTIHLHHWPCLQTVQICLVASYEYKSSQEEAGNKSIWVSCANDTVRYQPDFVFCGLSYLLSRTS